jgi:dipeptidase D
MTFVADFEPRALWRHFDHILTIPRGSKNEAAMRRYVLEVGQRAGLAHREDGAGNVVLLKPGTAGMAQAPTVVLQSHLDMVNEKNSDVVHDFDRDPIRPRVVGDYLYATGTTLGSDNGIGVAAMLALAEATDLPHPPLELLFTIDEETGLTGANQIGSDMLSGRRLINLDSEEEGTITVGCAGGAGSALRLPLHREPVAEGSVAIAVEIAGLKGGHSGVDIHLQRANAVKVLARALWAALRAGIGFRVAALAGGNKHNAIPREARAVVVLAAADRDALLDVLRNELAGIADEVRAADPELTTAFREADTPADAWSTVVTRQAVALLHALPHGVLAMSLDIPGLVETSTNLATVAEQDGQLAIFMSNRSSVASALRATRARMAAFAALAGATTIEEGGYPGWKPNLASPVLAVTRRVHQRVIGREAHIGAIHAGLECGILGERFPGMDMVSIGPQIENPHSPDERVQIPTVGRFWDLLRGCLAELGS